MKIRFGMGLDGGCWPEFGQNQQSVIGEIIIGPQGLIGVLETALGLVPADEPEVLRIRQYMGCIQALGSGARFYSESFAADAWGTARELLSWRDELVLHGWEGKAEESPARIAAIAEIERLAHEAVSAGLADRFQTVKTKLQSSPSLPVSQVEVQERLALLPSPWRKLFEQLMACGVEIKEAQLPEVELEKVVRLESDYIWPLAQTLSAWIKGCDRKSDVTLLCQLDAGQLDQALHGQGLAATGQIAKSAQLGVFQLLPLMLENLWKPVRMDRLMELLSVPNSPVPGFAARLLVAAIAKEPGLESRKWQEALAEIAKRKCQYLIDDGTSEEEALSQAHMFAQDLDQWLHLSRVDVNADAPAHLAIASIQRLVEHLATIANQHPSARIAMGHCRDLLKVLKDMDGISKPLLDRILADVIGPGRSAGNLREAAPWGVITNPAQLIAPVDTLIWWGFTDHSSPSAQKWTLSEREWLTAHGVQIDRPQLARARERFYWQSLLKSCNRLLLCQPLELDGRTVPVHPLWFEIEADDALKARVSHQNALALLNDNSSQLMGVSLQLEKSVSQVGVSISPIRQINPVADFKPEKLSPSSMGSMFGCSFKWLLENLGITASDMMSFPEESAMIGTLAHQVLEDLLASGAIPDPADAQRVAADRFVIRVPQMAADLLLPENLAEYESIRVRVVEAAGDVVRRLKAAGFVRVECEEWIKTTLDGMPVNGRADVIAFDKDDKPHIIDFKYSFATNFYKEKISKGQDVQLITYSRMLGDEQSPVAYYLVPKRELLTNSPAFAEDVIETDDTLAEGWTRVCNSVGSTLKQIRSGKVIAQGLLGEDKLKDREQECLDNNEIYVLPPCKFCDFSSLCGVNRENSHE